MTESQKIKLEDFIKKSVFSNWYHEEALSGGEESYGRIQLEEKELSDEKKKLLNIFDGGQRTKLISLLDNMEAEIVRQVERDEDRWGVRGTGSGRSDSKPKLDLRSLRK